MLTVMKRSFIDETIDGGIAFCREMNVHLPLWAYWTPEDWAAAGEQAYDVRTAQLGWDITDFGSGDYARQGLLLLTLRNGWAGEMPEPMRKDYCEKLLFIDEQQITPCHFHWSKMEDIINRAGGNLVIRLWNADPETETRDEEGEVVVSVDGIETTVAAGGEVTLEPGQSITLPPYLYHLFYAQSGRGRVLGGEVSRVNDDANDNRFHEPLPRFPAIEEDAPKRHLLCTEYPPASPRRRRKR